jgi:hypothetical protein
MTEKTTEEYLKLKKEHASMFEALETIRANCFAAVLSKGFYDLMDIIESNRLEATKEIIKVQSKEQ